ncbi:MAG: sterol desaturase family protein [Candidatus Calescibacterium sp.]|nr:sterol desaturase family protein [Candidatus Calescibacterium sp.]MCX7734240.1 sterol desaturase family protein [bacterium]
MNQISSKEYWSNLRPKKGTTRLFESNFVEKFSRIPPYLPHLVYIPLVLYTLYLTYRSAIRPIYAINLFLFGIFCWTLFEYLLHRFVFHLNPKNKILQRFVYIMHGNHHEYPWDYMRLVMPLSVSIPLAVIFWYFYEFLLGVYSPPFYGGFVLGYLLYDTSHFLVHYERFNPKSRIFILLRKHHIRHHFLSYDGNFGVSSPLWDYIFGTNIEHKSREVLESRYFWK